jgi:hypothetical protein
MVQTDEGKTSMDLDIKTLRSRAWTALNPQTAQAAGMTLGPLQQWLVSAYTPTPVQLQALARYFGRCHG